MGDDNHIGREKKNNNFIIIIIITPKYCYILQAFWLAEKNSSLKCCIIIHVLK